MGDLKKMTKDILLVGLETRLPLYQGACEDSDYQFVFHVVSSLQETLQYLQDQTPNVIIVDHESLQEQSIEITQMLKKYPGTQRIPLMFIVDQSNTDVLLEVLDIPVNDYLFLPLNSEEFHIRLRTQCSLLEYKDSKQLISVNEKIEELKKLIKLFPEYTAARQELASIYERIGSVKDALHENLELVRFYYLQHNLGLAMEMLTNTKSMLSKNSVLLSKEAPQFSESLTRCIDCFNTMFSQN